MKLYSKVNFEMILQMSKFSASSPTSPTVLEGKVLFCGSQMGFWSPLLHCQQKCPPIFVLQKIYISPLVHCLQECPSMLSRFAKYQIQPTSLPSLLWFIDHNFLLQTCDLSDLWGVVIWGHLLLPHFAKCVWIRKLLQGSTVAGYHANGLCSHFGWVTARTCQAWTGMFFSSQDPHLSFTSHAQTLTSFPPNSDLNFSS